MRKKIAVPDTKRCKGCYYCVEACPKKCISISDRTNKKGYTVISVDESQCIGCGACRTVCPDLVFTVVDVDAN